MLCIFFFFSSRRRHTRSKRDWSSDVCSSDLILLTLITIAIMFSSIVIFGTDPHIPLAIVLLLLMMYGLSKKVSYKQLEEGITEGAKAGMAAVFLFFFIGILIAAWMFAGTIPTLIYA